MSDDSGAAETKEDQLTPEEWVKRKQFHERLREESVYISSTGEGDINITVVGEQETDEDEEAEAVEASIVEEIKQLANSKKAWGFMSLLLLNRVLDFVPQFVG
jgi:hypothetical protein